ncbi:MAG TPA: hypothetical protein PJ994_05895, partial [Tepidiformaceae bacterium]|nr:hypothetical protein [Tepidiformaceae bacterium]
DPSALAEAIAGAAGASLEASRADAGVVPEAGWPGSVPVSGLAGDGAVAGLRWTCGEPTCLSPEGAAG